MTKKKQMHLGLVGLAPGSHMAAWRHPNAQPDAHVDLKFWRRMVETAERGKFDMLFLADIMGPMGADHNHPDAFQRTPYGILEPLTLLSALSTYTEHLGLVSTISTSVNGPYQIARVFNSLDLLSGGRAGWNIVTTPHRVEHALTTAPLAGKDAQYDRAREVANCVFDFWDGWSEESFPRDREACQFVSLEKARVPNREGTYYRIDGPLNMPRPVQGRPVIVQAGMSEVGKTLGADFADIIFTIQPTLESAKVFYKDMKARIAAAGRDPDSVLIMPGFAPFVGSTHEEAEALDREMLACIDPQASLATIRYIHDVDLSSYPLDGPIPEMVGGNARNNGFFDAVNKTRVAHPDWTVLDLLRHLSSTLGHPKIIGTPTEIADIFEQWVEEEGADGLLILPPLFPVDLDRFVDMVVPELQKRGRFRTEYEATTLRGNLGIPTPRR